MEKKNEPNCGPCEQKFEKKVGTMVDEVENYSAKDHEKRSSELKDAFGGTDQGRTEQGSTGHGREHEASSMHNNAGNPSQKQGSWDKNKEQGTCRGDNRGKEENCAGRENYRKEHNAFGEKDPHSHHSDEIHDKEHRG